MRTCATWLMVVALNGGGAALAQTAVVPRLPAGESTANYRLTFQDEFVPLATTATGLNASVWNDAIWYETSRGPVNYGVRATGSDGVTRGVLKIWPQPEGATFHNRTLTTDGRFTQAYGFFEMRARLPRGVGPWPGFWIFNHIGTRRPEIDIMEAFPGAPPPPTSYWATPDHEARAYGVTVWRDATRMVGWKQIDKGINLSRSFNTYGVKWETNRMTFYFNGAPVYSVNARITDRLFILLSLWYGSESGTPSTDPAITPIGEGNAFEIDYVRVWKLPGY